MGKDVVGIDRELAPNLGDVHMSVAVWERLIVRGSGSILPLNFP